MTLNIHKSTFIYGIVIRGVMYVSEDGRFLELERTANEVNI